MTINDSLFKSPVDERWYFWVGNGLQGPFDEYTDAHLAMSKQLKELRGKEETNPS